MNASPARCVWPAEQATAQMRAQVLYQVVTEFNLHTDEPTI